MKLLLISLYDSQIIAIACLTDWTRKWRV